MYCWKVRVYKEEVGKEHREAIMMYNAKILLSRGNPKCWELQDLLWTIYSIYEYTINITNKRITRPAARLFFRKSLELQMSDACKM